MQPKKPGTWKQDGDGKIKNYKKFSILFNDMPNFAWTCIKSMKKKRISIKLLKFKSWKSSCNFEEKNYVHQMDFSLIYLKEVIDIATKFQL